VPGRSRSEAVSSRQSQAPEGATGSKDFSFGASRTVKRNEVTRNKRLGGDQGRSPSLGPLTCGPAVDGRDAETGCKGNVHRFFGLLFERYYLSRMDPNSKATPETVALARQILRSIYFVTEGRHLATCRLGSIPNATTGAVMYAIRAHWIELKSDSTVCLTDEGRRLAIKQAN
jgi:hypothetical protein